MILVEELKHFAMNQDVLGWPCLDLDCRTCKWALGTLAIRIDVASSARFWLQKRLLTRLFRLVQTTWKGEIHSSDCALRCTLFVPNAVGLTASVSHGFSWAGKDLAWHCSSYPLQELWHNGYVQSYIPQKASKSNVPIPIMSLYYILHIIPL